jgi:4-hydroxybenzoate polyprenyltransferase
MALFRFFVYSNLFIAACAVLMVGQTCQLMLHAPADPDLLGFVFFATLCSYSFHWYLSPDSGTGSSRKDWQQDYHFVHGILFFVGLVGAGLYAFSMLKLWFWLLLSAVPTFLYSAPKIPHPVFRRLRKIALGKTIFLAMVWMYVTTILPFVAGHGRWHGDMTLFVIARFFLIYAICILFDYRDRADDKRKGIRSLITYLSESGIRNLFWASIAIFILASCALGGYGYKTTLIALLLLPGIITAVFYRYSKKNFSDILYYFILDGLMALSSFLTLLTGI